MYSFDMETDNGLASVTTPLARGERIKVRGFGVPNRMKRKPSPFPSPLERARRPTRFATS
jgi:nucleoid DNA-binding protein